MNKISERMKMQEQLSENKEYDYEKNLNWRDDGDELTDPTMNDYLKGYKIDPYAFQQWAKKNKIDLKKIAAREVRDMHYSSQYFADEILTLWNGVDGALQNFYEGFTLRFDNKMKKEIAHVLEGKGFTVYPVLVDDRPRYAKNDKLRKLIASNDSLRLIVSELEDLQESGVEVTKQDAADLLDYYKLIYPEDYAISLITIQLDDIEEKETKFDLYQDFSISDESLEATENMMSGNADPSYVKDYGFGNFNYDYLSDSRSDGTQPQDYEIRVNKRLDKKKV